MVGCMGGGWARIYNVVPLYVGSGGESLRREALPRIHHVLFDVQFLCRFPAHKHDLI